MPPANILDAVDDFLNELNKPFVLRSAYDLMDANPEWENNPLIHTIASKHEISSGSLIKAIHETFG